jgi:hemerythrin-like domain-containing protein
MTPTETLKHEHKVVLLVLKGAEREGRSAQTTGKFNVGDVERMVEFFKNFVDRCHHTKEERCLFTKLEERGMAHGGPIAVMLMEHEEGRRRIASIAQNLPKAKAGDRSAIAAIGDDLVAYAQLLRDHIDKEDNVLYAMADRILTAQDQQGLAEAFEKIEAEEIGEPPHVSHAVPEVSHVSDGDPLQVEGFVVRRLEPASEPSQVRPDRLGGVDTEVVGGEELVKWYRKLVHDRHLRNTILRVLAALFAEVEQTLHRRRT